MLVVGTLMTMTIEELLLLSFDNYFIVKWFKCNPSRKKHGWCMQPKAGIDTMISLFKLIFPVFIWFLWEGFSSWLPISRYCLLWLMPHGFGQSHIRERRLPHVPYKFEFKTHVYHYYTCSSGRGVPCTQVLATKLCGCQANIGYKASPWPEMKIPKADNTWDGHCPQKRLLMWEGFWSRPPISRYCPLWLMPHGFVQSHIG